MSLIVARLKKNRNKASRGLLLTPQGHWWHDRAITGWIGKWVGLGCSALVLCFVLSAASALMSRQRQRQRQRQPAWAWAWATQSAMLIALLGVGVGVGVGGNAGRYVRDRQMWQTWLTAVAAYSHAENRSRSHNQKKNNNNNIYMLLCVCECATIFWHVHFAVSRSIHSFWLGLSENI